MYQPRKTEAVPVPAGVCVRPPSAMRVTGTPTAVDAAWAAAVHANGPSRGPPALTHLAQSEVGFR